jgi:phenylpyruvate tautomerase PptA (4-oxalocrotonate tautomerase family)
MPILEIEIVTRPGEALPAGLAAALANRTAQVLGAAPGSVWVKMRALPAQDYAENAGDGPAEAVFPVFVSVLKARLPAPEAIAAEAAALAAAVAHLCERSADEVHILYLPEGAGRMAFGGKLG